jgi:hypothetical protein
MTQFPNAQSVAERIPAPLEDVLLSGYYRALGWQADRSHESISSEFSRQDDAPEHIVVLVIDALRPDHQPSLDLEFTSAVAPGTWTFPSVTSLHTGTYPHEHEAVAHTAPENSEYLMPAQAEPTQTLPSVLESAGYETYGGFAFMTPFLATKGWYQTHRVYRDASAEAVLKEYGSWRMNRDKTFAYLHFGDVHAPITPPKEYVERHNVDTSIDDLSRLVRFTDDYDGKTESERFRTHRLRLYRAALEYVEDQIRELLRGIGTETMVVVTGDHGEGHWEHYQLDKQFTDSRPNYCVGHGGTPFDIIARVPLALQFEGESRTPTEGGFPSLRDLPTVVSNLVVEEQPFEGHTWDSPIPESQTVFCEGTRYGAERKAAYRDGRKIIRSETDDITLHAEVESLSGEQFVEEPDDSFEGLVNSLPDYWSDGNIDPNPGPMVEDQLSALGYK